MRELLLKGGVKRVEGELRVPSDKSISHRAVIFGALARGETLVHSWLRSADTLATLRIIRSLGVRVREQNGVLRIYGSGFVLSEPENVLNAGNSGTTARLIMGVLATQPFFSVLTGDKSLRRRPMLRVTSPLREMGASIDGRESGNRLPLSIRGGKLRGITFFNRRSSALSPAMRRADFT